MYCECGSYAEAFTGTNNKWKRLKTVCHEPKADNCGKNDAYTQMKSNFTIEIQNGLIKLMSGLETIITIEDTDLTDDEILPKKIEKSKLK